MAVDLISIIAEKARANNAGSNYIHAAANNSDLIVSLPVNSIKYHPKNHLYFRDLDKAMKDKLMEDMRDNGQINPIIVKKNEDITYTVLAGHQRLIAARRLNWQQIKAIVIEVSEYEAEKLLIRDNLFRRHMGGMELARALEAYSKLSDNQTKKSIRQIADEIGENRNTIHFYMKLNTLIPEIQQLVEEKKLSATAAQAFTSLNEEEQRKSFEVLGESLIGIKKKELEEEIRKQYDNALLEAETEKTQIKTERDKLLTEIKEKENDIYQYQGQAEFLKEKAFKAGLPEEVRNALSKIDVIDSLAASISLGDIEIFELDTLILILKKYDNVFEYLSTCRKLLENTINTKSNAVAIQSSETIKAESL
jgi:ParB family transcriptional regulator, chromosome partitioning protein